MSRTDRHRAASSAEDLVAWFTEGWRKPDLRVLLPSHRAAAGSGRADGAAARRAPPGHDAFCRNIATLFAAMPDVHANVLDWRGDERTVFIEFHLQGTLGGRPLRLHVTDRFTQEDGLVTERVSFFDPAPLLVAALRNPRALLALATMRRRGRALYETAFPSGIHDQPGAAEFDDVVTGDLPGLRSVT